jgi:uncharacterized protein YbjT (DUF2867 family)
MRRRAGERAIHPQRSGEKASMGDTILVTGATGNVGGELVRLLSAQGASVRAAVRHPEAVPMLPGVVPVRFDYGEPATWGPVLEDVTAIFVLPIGNPNVLLPAVPFMEQARAAGVRRAVLMTYRGANTEPPDASGAAPEGGGLRMAELALIDSGLGYTILRPTWFMQNFTHGFIAPMVRAGTIFLPTGEGKTAFIDVRDIAACTAVTLTQPGHIGAEYDLTGGQALSYGEAAAILGAAAGREIKYVSIPPEAYRASLIEAGVSVGEADMLTGLFALVRTGGEEAVTPAVSTLLGRAPITLEQFAHDYAGLLRAGESSLAQ